MEYNYKDEKFSKKNFSQYTKNDHSKKSNNEKEKYKDVIAGKNCVKEALNSGRALESILIAKGSKGGASAALVALAKDKGIPVKEVDSKKLDYLCGSNGSR